MRKILHLSGLASVLLFFALVSPRMQAADQPNFLFLLSDDQAWNGLSCRMHPDVAASKSDFIQMSYHALHYPENANRALVEKYRAKNPSGNDKEIGRAAIAEDLDRGVGELMAKIDALGIADNTCVIYMSDNGGSARRALPGGKGGVWEGGIRVPPIIRGPGIAADSWCHQRVVGHDLYNTFCELAGVEQPLPSNIEGGSITHLLRGVDEAVKRPREEVVFRVAGASAAPGR